MRFRTLTVCALALILVAVAAGQSPKAMKTGNGRAGQSDWPMYGRDLAGSFYNPHEKKITPETVSRLKQKWTFETGADVSSTPIVVGGIVYFGSWDGKEYALDAATGNKIWEFDCEVSTRSGAAYADGVLYFGDIGGRLYALDAKTGAQKWKVRIDSHRDTVATSSPIYHNGRVYIGVSSHEEGTIMKDRNYECCTFRGGVAAYDARTGQQIWRYYTIPETPTPQGKDKKGKTIIGPAGGAVWSTVSVHPRQNRIYVTTGNQYTGPASKYPNAIIALDMSSGKPVWANQATEGDIWTFDCRNNPDCKDLDVDFGTVALTFKGPGGRTLVGAGAKSGWFYAVDAKDGSLVWKREIGSGGKLGGIEFGNATDGERIYVALSNFPRQGNITALDPATGKILWQTPAPDKGSNFGPVTVVGAGADRLVFAGTNKNFVRAYNAADGKILWEFDTGGSVGGGITVADGVVYVGSGYSFLGIGKRNNKLYAFSIDGK